MFLILMAEMALRACNAQVKACLAAAAAGREFIPATLAAAMSTTAESTAEKLDAALKLESAEDDEEADVDRESIARKLSQKEVRSSHQTLVFSACKKLTPKTHEAELVTHAVIYMRYASMWLWLSPRRRGLYQARLSPACTASAGQGPGWEGAAKGCQLSRSIGRHRYNAVMDCMLRLLLPCLAMTC